MSHEALVVASSRSYDADHPRAVTAPERARDLMEMVISHSEIDAMRLSRCPQGDPWRPDAATLRDGAPDSGRRAPPAGRRAGAARFFCIDSLGLPRKEVIQPHLPVRLPCYDFTPLTNHTFGVSLLKG